MWEITYCVIDLWCLRQNHFLCRSRSYHRGIGVLGRSALSIERGQPVGVEVRSCQVILRSRASAHRTGPSGWSNTSVALALVLQQLVLQWRSFPGCTTLSNKGMNLRWSTKDIYRPRHHLLPVLPAACLTFDIVLSLGSKSRSNEYGREALWTCSELENQCHTSTGGWSGKRKVKLRRRKGRSIKRHWNSSSSSYVSTFMMRSIGHLYLSLKIN